MLLALHEKPIQLLLETTPSKKRSAAGHGCLLSIDTGGTVALWESSTCHCITSTTLPELAHLTGLRATYVQAAHAVALCGTSLQASRNAATPGAAATGAAGSANAQRGRAYALKDSSEDLESKFARLMGGAKGAEAAAAAVGAAASLGGTMQGAAALQTDLEVILLDLKSLTVVRTLDPLAAVPLTGVALAQAQARSQQAHGGSKATAALPSGGPSASGAGGDSGDAQEIVLALQCQVYDRQQLENPHDAAGRALLPAVMAIIAVTSFGRMVFWDSGGANAADLFPGVEYSNVVETLPGTPVAAAVSKACRHVALVTPNHWALLQASTWHPTLLVPTLFVPLQCSSVHTLSLPRALGAPSTAKPAELAGCTFLEVPIVQGARALSRALGPYADAAAVAQTTSRGGSIDASHNGALASVRSGSLDASRAVSPCLLVWDNAAAAAALLVPDHRYSTDDFGDELSNCRAVATIPPLRPTRILDRAAARLTPFREGPGGRAVRIQALTELEQSMHFSRGLSLHMPGMECVNNGAGPAPRGAGGDAAALPSFLRSERTRSRNDVCIQQHLLGLSYSSLRGAASDGGAPPHPAAAAAEGGTLAACWRGSASEFGAPPRAAALPAATAAALVGSNCSVPASVAFGRSDGSLQLRPLLFAAVRGVDFTSPVPRWFEHMAGYCKVLQGHDAAVTCIEEIELQTSCARTSPPPRDTSASDGALRRLGRDAQDGTLAGHADDADVERRPAAGTAASLMSTALASALSQPERDQQQARSGMMTAARGSSSAANLRDHQGRRSSAGLRSSSRAAAADLIVSHERIIVTGCAAGRVCGWSYAVQASHRHSDARYEGAAGSQGARSAANVRSSSASQEGLERGGAAGDSGGCAESWRECGKLAFSLNVLTEAVWKILAPPKNVPRPWHETVIVLGCNGAAAVVNLRRHAVACVLQAPITSYPTEVAWDAYRGYLATMCATSPQAAAQQPQTPRDDDTDKAALYSNNGAPPASAALATGADRDASKDDGDEEMLLLWDLHSQGLERVCVGPEARAQFSAVVRCLQAHYPNFSNLVRELLPATTMRHVSRFDTSHERISSIETASRGSCSSQLTRTNSEVAELGTPRSPVRGPSMSGSPSHKPFDASSRAQQSDMPGSQRMRHSSAIKVVHVHSAPRPGALCTLMSPVKGTLLVQLNVSRLVNEPEGSVDRDDFGSARSARHGADQGSGGPAAASACSALALLHRWGASGAADAALASVLLDAMSGASALATPLPSTPAQPDADTRGTRGDSEPWALLRLAEDALVSTAGGLAMQLPTRLHDMPPPFEDFDMSGPFARREDSSRGLLGSEPSVRKCLDWDLPSDAAPLPAHAHTPGGCQHPRAPSKTGEGRSLSVDLWMDKHSERATAAGGADTAKGSRVLTPVHDRSIQVDRDAFANATPPGNDGDVSVELPSPASPFAGRAHGAVAASPTPFTVGTLWNTSRGWLAVRLLLVIALCRSLQGIAKALPNAPHAAMALTTLYAHDLTRPRISGGTGLSHVLPLPPPALGVFVGLWSSRIPSVKEAARLIMSACTAPVELSRDLYDLLMSNHDPIDRAASTPSPVCDTPFDVLRDLSTRGPHSTTPTAGWEVSSVMSAPGGIDATAVAAGLARAGSDAGWLAASPGSLPATPTAAADTVVLLPEEVLGISSDSTAASPDPMQVLLTSAACAIHSKALPESIARTALAHLVRLAMSVPAPHSAAAASVLCDLLQGSHPTRWLPYLGPIPALIIQLNETFLRVHHAVEAAQPRHAAAAAAAAAAAPPGADASAAAPTGHVRRGPRSAANAVSLWARRLPARDRALLLLPDIRATYYVRDAATYTPPAVASRPNNARPHRLDRFLARVHSVSSSTGTPRASPLRSGSPPSHTATSRAVTPATDTIPVDPHDLANSHTSPDSLVHSASYRTPTYNELLNARSTLTSLAGALARIDFTAFLHSFNTRIGIGSSRDPNTPTHAMALSAIVALLRTASGRAAVLTRLPMLCDTMLRLLDPQCSGRRMATLQIVVALMNEVCLRYPMIAAHNGRSMFAVAQPESTVDDSGSAAASAACPITIYNMNTGIKTHVLLLSRSASRERGTTAQATNPIVAYSQAASSASAVCGISAIAFRKDGLAIAAYSRVSGFLYVWTLQPAWAARMSVNTAQKSPLSTLLGVSMSAQSHVSQLEPYRVMAAPPEEGPGDETVSPFASSKAGAAADLTYNITWTDDGQAVQLLHNGKSLGSMPAQCP